VQEKLYRFRFQFVCFFGGIGLVTLLIVLALHTRFEGAKDPPEKPNYAIKSNWAALPGVGDSADIVPAGCGEDRQSIAHADCFYIYPTSFFDENRWHSSTNDFLSNFVIDGAQVKSQASAFNGAARVYVPRYRQVSQKKQDEGQTGNKMTEKLTEAMSLAAGDVIAAFQYYLENYNNGRPFFIAAHSQGTLHGVSLLQHILGANPALLEKGLIAAYLIGNTVENEDLPELRVCQNRTDTHCFLSYNSVPAGSTNDWWLLKSKSNRTVCVNPLTWSPVVDNIIASKELNIGSFGVTGPLFLTKLDMNLVDAVCGDKGLLYVTDPKKSGFEPFPGDSPFHPYDYPFFYKNIRVNAIERANAYFSHTNPDNVLNEEACYACGGSGNCVGAFIGDIFLFVVLPLIVFSPIFICSVYVLGLFSLHIFKNRKGGLATVTKGFCKSLSFWRTLRISCCCFPVVCYRMYSRWKLGRKKEPEGGSECASEMVSIKD
jgi:hypothetical protein